MPGNRGGEDASRILCDTSSGRDAGGSAVAADASWMVRVRKRQGKFKELEEARWLVA